MSAGLARVSSNWWRAFGARWVLWGGTVVALGVGCGARGIVDEETSIDVLRSVGGSGPVSGLGGSTSGLGGSTSGGLGGSTSGGLGGSGGSSGDDEMVRYEITDLPRCSLGYLWSARGSRACNFRFSDRCYDTPTTVCACACPAESNRSCVLAGFLQDPDNPLTVTCVSRR